MLNILYILIGNNDNYFQDLNEKIEYMQQLGVQNVVLTSVFQAEGDKVVDFMQVKSSLGNNVTIKDLIKNLKTKGKYY